MFDVQKVALLFINLSSIVRFPKSLGQGVPCKTENWHALPHEQYFSKHRFLDIWPCAFKYCNEKTPYFIVIFSFQENFASWKCCQCPC